MGFCAENRILFALYIGGFECLTIQGTRAPFITIFAMKCIPERFGRQCAARNGPFPEDTLLHFYTTTSNRYHHVRACCCSPILSLEQGQSQGAQLRRAIDFSKRNGIFSGIITNHSRLYFSALIASSLRWGPN